MIQPLHLASNVPVDHGAACVPTNLVTKGLKCGSMATLQKYIITRSTKSQQYSPTNMTMSEIATPYKSMAYPSKTINLQKFPKPCTVTSCIFLAVESSSRACDGGYHPLLASPHLCWDCEKEPAGTKPKSIMTMLPSLPTKFLSDTLPWQRPNWCSCIKLCHMINSKWDEWFSEWMNEMNQKKGKQWHESINNKNFKDTGKKQGWCSLSPVKSWQKLPWQMLPNGSVFWLLEWLWLDKVSSVAAL